jgi:putative transposase
MPAAKLALWRYDYNMPIAPSTYYEHLAKRADPARLSDRARRDEALRPEILRVFEENWRVYGVRKIWRQLGREGFDVARCTVARLMKDMGIQGIIRGKPHRTTIPDKKAAVSAGQGEPPVPGACAEHAVGQRLHLCRHLEGVSSMSPSSSTPMPAASSAGASAPRRMRGSFSMPWNRRCMIAAPVKGMGLVHHSDRGSQYLSIKYTERLAEAGIEPSVGSVGDSYDNALAETINGLFKAEVIHRRGPWRSFEAVEYATLEWVDWFNNRRLLEPIGNIPPAEAEANFYAALETEPMAA